MAAATAEAATVQGSFEFPSSGQAALSAAVPDAAWSKEPWDYSKAYLVLYLKDETQDTNSNWVPDDLPITVAVNGVAKAIYTYKTSRRQEKGLTRCYFAALGGETQPGGSNTVEISLPAQRGLVFSGAYLDLPDQTPVGELARD